MLRECRAISFGSQLAAVGTMRPSIEARNMQGVVVEEIGTMQKLQ